MNKVKGISIKWTNVVSLVKVDENNQPIDITEKDFEHPEWYYENDDDLDVAIAERLEEMNWSSFEQDDDGNYFVYDDEDNKYMFYFDNNYLDARDVKHRLVDVEVSDNGSYELPFYPDFRFNEEEWSK